ncbi:hypothetical protein DITRI_Ditri17bG0037100 [Diplodiscus trichospermus]
MVNREALRNVLSKVWKSVGGLKVKGIEDKLYIFHFERPIEKDRVLLQQLWYFNRALLLITEFDALTLPSKIDLKTYDFWMQVHGLPLGMMNEKVGIVIGKSIGEVLEINALDDNIA